MDDYMCCMLCAGTQLENGKNRAWRGRWPARARLVRSSSSWRLEKQRPCKICACSPARDRKARESGSPRAEDPLSGRRVQPTGSRSQHHCYLVRGVFKRDKGVPCRAGNVVWQAGPRNVWMREAGPCVPSPKRRVDMSICDPGGRALSVRTGETFCVYPLRGSPTAFDLTPGAYSRRRRLHN